MKLLYGEYEYYQNYLYKKHVVDGDDLPCLAFNYSGLREDVNQLFLLPEVEMKDFGDGPLSISGAEFDQQYMNWIFSNNQAFCRLMYMLNLLLQGVDIYIVVSDDPWTSILAESFLKILQQRYGLNAYHINSLEDFEYIVETDLDPFFGIRNYNNDTVRYNDIKETVRIENGGRPYYE